MPEVEIKYGDEKRSLINLGDIKEFQSKLPKEAYPLVKPILEKRKHELSEQIKFYEGKIQYYQAKQRTANHERRFWHLDRVVLTFSEMKKILEWAEAHEEKVKQYINPLFKGAIIIKGLAEGDDINQSLIFDVSEGVKIDYYLSVIEKPIISLVSKNEILSDIIRPKPIEDDIEIVEKIAIREETLHTDVANVYHCIMAFISFYPKLTEERKVKYRKEEPPKKSEPNSSRYYTVNLARRIKIVLPENYRQMTKREFNYYLGQWMRIGHFKTAWVLPDYFERNKNSNATITGFSKDKFIQIRFWIDAKEIHRRKQNEGLIGVKKYVHDIPCTTS